MSAYKSDQILAIFGLMVCLSLIIVSVPRLVAACYLFYSEQIDKQFKEDTHSITLKHHLKSDLYINKALQWFETAETWQMLTISQVRQQKKMQTIYQTNSQGLALSPVDPYGWYRQAIIEKNLHADIDKIINDLRLSCYAGRVEPGLLIKRVNQLHYYRAHLDHEMQALLRDQIRLANLLKQQDLVNLVQQKPSLMVLIQDALSNEQLDNFLKQLNVADFLHQ